jgi:phosphate transport system permease protein
MSSMVFRRKMMNYVVLSASVLITMITLFFLLWILQSTILYGIRGIGWHVITQNTPAPGSSGGLANALAGSLLMIGLGILIGGPIGILAGTFLGEFGTGNRIAGIVRFFNDVLLSTPSIIIGLFIYTVAVVPMGRFSGFAGALALAMIALPVIVRTSDEMLQLVPGTMREAALALGAPRWKVITSISYKAAAPGILTGFLLAISRISGETAPLLFTALNNQFWSTNIFHPIANLPVVIFQFAMSPYEGWKNLAWTGALIAIAGVLGLNFVSRIIFHRARQHRS